MKPFDQLTRLGKLRRQRVNARHALAQYDLEITRADLISADTNLIYRVRATDGRRYILRLAYPGWRTRENAVSEVMWLDALARDTDIPVPRVLRAKNGSGVVQAGEAGAAHPQHALLTTWLPGTVLGKRLTETNLSKMGKLFGKLHLHAGTWKPPAGFAPQTFARFLSRGEPDVLLTEACRDAFTPPQREIITQMRARVEAAYAALPPEDLRVIHCDLWHDNIKVYKGELAPFDFEDTIWGYRLHDLAMGLLDLAEDAGIERYEILLPIFREAYERYLPWPAGDLGILQMGRALWRLNWVANHMRERLPGAVAFNADLFERFERTGKLSAPL